MLNYRPLLVFITVFILLALAFPPPSLETLNIRSSSWFGTHFDKYWDLRILKVASSNHRWYLGVFSIWIRLPRRTRTARGSLGYGACLDIPDIDWNYHQVCVCLPGYRGSNCTSFLWEVDATVRAILLINLLIYILWKLLPRQRMERYFLVTHNWNLQPWTLVLGSFSHRTIGHLIYNMMFLRTTAQALSKSVSHEQLVLIYLVSGVLGWICSIYVTRMRKIDYFETLGSSGAIYGLLGMLWSVDPGFIFYFYQQPLNLPQYVVVSVLLDLVLRQNQIDVAAHLGGLVAGKLLTERVLSYLQW